jgi:hypothetical protein
LQLSKNNNEKSEFATFDAIVILAETAEYRNSFSVASQKGVHIKLQEMNTLEFIFKSTADMLSTSTSYASVCLSVYLSIYLYLTLAESESQIREVWLKINLEGSGMIKKTV